MTESIWYAAVLATEKELLTKAGREYYSSYGVLAQHIWIARKDHGCVRQHSMEQSPTSSFVLPRGSIQVSDRGWELQRMHYLHLDIE
jgi:hypothetical protein